MYTIPRIAVAWTVYLNVLAQYTVQKTRLDSDFKNFRVLFFFSSPSQVLKMTSLMSKHCLQMFETQSGTAFRFTTNCTNLFRSIARTLSFFTPKYVHDRDHTVHHATFKPYMIETMLLLLCWYIIVPFFLYND